MKLFDFFFFFTINNQIFLNFAIVNCTFYEKLFSTTSVFFALENWIYPHTSLVYFIKGREDSISSRILYGNRVLL